MEIRRITKTDGKRLFVEISRKMIEGKGFLKHLNKGDEVLVLPRRSLSEEETRKLVGKYIHYWNVDLDDFMTMEFEGLLKRNNGKFLDDEGKPLEGKYVLVDFTLTDKPNGEPMDSFDRLEGVYGLEVMPERYANFKKTPCINKKCRKQSLATYKYCPHCSKRKPKDKGE